MKLPSPLALLVLLLAFTGLACSNTGTEPAAKTGTNPQTDAAAAPQAAGEPVDGDWIVTHSPTEPPTLNPFLESAGADTVRVVDGNGGFIYENLVTYDSDTLEVIPWIAESWTISEDKLAYTFKLKQNVTFSDGVPLTANDVKFTFDTVLDPKNLTADRRSYLSGLKEVNVLDDYTIEFKCAKPYFLNLITLGTQWVLPKHIFGTGDFNTHPNNRAPIGSGPYLFESWQTGSAITLARNPNYWGEKKPHVDKIMFKIITDDNAAFLELQNGGIDEMRITNAEQWTNRTNTPKFTDQFDKYSLWSPVNGYLGTFNWIAWNMRRPLFEDKHVRRAMTMLLDRQRILDKVYYGLGRVVTGYSFPDNDDYDKTIEPWPYDPDRAVMLLEEAGWKDTDNDGIRDKNGVPFKFEWIFASGVNEYEIMATVYKEQLDKVGINMTIRPLEWASFIESVTKREFDACMMAWVSPIESDPYQIWHSSQTENGSNYPGFKNAEVDRLIEEARVEFDEDKRNALYREFHKILHEEQPYTFLFNRKRNLAVSKRFEGVKEQPLGFDFRDWWVPVAAQKYR
ncbi:MAG: hypothetical protein HYV27_07080 [Candidatus Hydrogenedentes bacterium]|nr:hypothetical protein [Candidatus Hydrogenedentota bacterium]